MLLSVSAAACRVAPGGSGGADGGGRAPLMPPAAPGDSGAIARRPPTGDVHAAFAELIEE
jgi:hypothetical protein